MNDERLDRIVATANDQQTAREAVGAPAAPVPATPAKPTLIAVDFAQKSVITSVGFAPLTEKELKAITPIALAAFGRMLDGVLDTVGASVRFKKRGRPRKKAAPSPTGKRRGRPPKVKPVPVEAASVPAPATPQ